MEKINKVIYINLKHRTDRNAQIKEELLKMFPEDKIVRFEAIYNEIGGAGCGLSHKACIKYAMDNNLDNILIVEDDFFFKVSKEALATKINRLYEEHPDFDICLFGRKLIKGKLLGGALDSLSIVQVYDAQTTSCYFLSKKFYDKLYDIYNTATYNLLNKAAYGTYSIDQYWKKLQTDENKFLTFYPAVGEQRMGWSDIEKRYVNYQC